MGGCLIAIWGTWLRAMPDVAVLQQIPRYGSPCEIAKCRMDGLRHESAGKRMDRELPYSRDRHNQLMGVSRPPASFRLVRFPLQCINMVGGQERL
jgi:hypothetical protein